MAKQPIPIPSSRFLMLETHGKLHSFASLKDAHTRGFAWFRFIRSQFFNADLVAYVRRDILPRSKSIPTFVVCFDTPRTCLQVI